MAPASTGWPSATARGRLGRQRLAQHAQALRQVDRDAVGLAGQPGARQAMVALHAGRLALDAELAAARQAAAVAPSDGVVAPLAEARPPGPSRSAPPSAGRALRLRGWPSILHRAAGQRAGEAPLTRVSSRLAAQRAVERHRARCSVARQVALDWRCRHRARARCRSGTSANPAMKSWSPSRGRQLSEARDLAQRRCGCRSASLSARWPGAPRSSWPACRRAAPRLGWKVWRPLSRPICGAVVAVAAVVAAEADADSSKAVLGVLLAQRVPRQRDHGVLDAV